MSDLEQLVAGTDPGYAATVVLLRDGELGVEVLLAERPRDRGSFAGAWVFPGGAVDEADLGGDAEHSEWAARRAAARETREEVGLDIDPVDLVPFSRWTPPEGAQKRLITTFFAVRVPDGELRLAPDEVMAVEWIRPVDALERHAQGAMTLWPPTWVTLHTLQRHESVDAALRDLASRDIRPYVSRFQRDRTVLVWQEDAEFDADGEHADRPAVPDDAPDADLDRHRLMMDRLPWVYLNSF
ncbi:NUDIX domain-containing protein [Agromyces larvae]|uniref:NUDIX domain-containing protein n=1 Tax=Agromyces larvae TaxID=2929802 RepID=A0ABY4BZN0_9MICO|nr:NUDIX domain-containing protein [Agromyces larvae]UOE44204.1 NUDIX domain-containing protein [Agromyces larvae]